MKRGLLNAMLVLLFGLSVWVGVVPMASAKGGIDFGVDYHTWDSNFRAKGYETVLPLSLAFMTPNGRFQLTATTAFVQGHYVAEDVGFGGLEFNGNRMTDSVLGMGYSFPMGSFQSALALQANLPTGDEKWETYQNPAYEPSVFVSSRYRGYGFGLSGIYGLGKDFSGGWNVTATGGYIYSSEVDNGLAWGKTKPGSYVLAGLAVSRKFDNGLLRLKANQYIAQDTEADGEAVFRAPGSTALAFHAEGGQDFRLLLDLAYTLYGKAKFLDEAGGLATEKKVSFGDRFSVEPAIDYKVSESLRMTTGGILKFALKNDYAQDDGLYNGGGALLGVAQSARLKVGPKTYLRMSLGYNHITDRDAALDDSDRLTDVTYNDVSFGTGVGYQW